MNFSLESILNNTQALIDRAQEENANIIENAVVAPSEPVPTNIPPLTADQRKGFYGYEGTDFTVDRRDVFGPEGNKIPNYKGIFVGDKCVNMVSNSYEIHQPSEIIETFRQVAHKTGLTINKVLTNPHNGGLLIGAKYGSRKINGEDHDIDLSFYTAHCGRYSTFMTLDGFRIACHNQAPMLYKNNARHILKEKHYKNALKLEKIEQILTYLPESIEAYAERANALYEKPLSFKTLVDMFVAHYKLDPEAKQFQTKLDQFKATYYNAEGQKHLQENAWKAYQAITYLNTHGGRNTDYRVENVLTKKSDDSLKWLETLRTA